MILGGRREQVLICRQLRLDPYSSALFPLVVVRDLDVVGMASLPAETDPILVVDPDAPLPQTFAA